MGHSRDTYKLVIDEGDGHFINRQDHSDWVAAVNAAMARLNQHEIEMRTSSSGDPKSLKITISHPGADTENSQ